MLRHVSYEEGPDYWISTASLTNHIQSIFAPRMDEQGREQVCRGELSGTLTWKSPTKWEPLMSEPSQNMVEAVESRTLVSA
jgi:hypothetical protein